MTNHALVLWCLRDWPTARLRDLAGVAHVTERAAQRIVTDLVDAGYVSRTKEGQRNRYDVDLDQPLRHPVHAGKVTAGELLACLPPFTRPGSPPPPGTRG